MEEDEYRETYHTVNDLPCVFEKAVLSRRCGCVLLRKLLIAEREAASCTSAAARDDCLALLQHMRENARFALRQTDMPSRLPHGQEIKVQAGGLLGLQQALAGTAASDLVVTDIRALLQQALATYGGWNTLPYPEIVKAIVHFEGRRPRRRR
jgi:hypothetical protein